MSQLGDQEQEFLNVYPAAGWLKFLFLSGLQCRVLLIHLRQKIVWLFNSKHCGRLRLSGLFVVADWSLLSGFCELGKRFNLCLFLWCCLLFVCWLLWTSRTNSRFQFAYLKQPEAFMLCSHHVEHVILENAWISLDLAFCFVFVF